MKVAVIYWSGTGNTEQMANAILEGAKTAGAAASLLTPAEVDASTVAAYDTFAFGCPAMGAEELEETEFAPMFDTVEPLLAGKKVALFGSYGWGGGEWMQLWEDRCKNAGIALLQQGLICADAPDADVLAACRQLGAALAK